MLTLNKFNQLIECAYRFLMPYSANMLTEQTVVNKHSTHVEEMIFTKHQQGLEDALEGLTYIIKNIGKDVGNVVSKKIDGAPSVMCSWVGDQFAVASKSIFNKNPKVNFTEQQIDENHPQGLATTLKYCLKYFKCINMYLYDYKILSWGDLMNNEVVLEESSVKTKRTNLNIAII